LEQGEKTMEQGKCLPISPEVRIGHVHLKVTDLDRSIGFYSGILGFDVTQRFGKTAAFLAVGGYHHHIGLNTWESEGDVPPHENSTGPYHTAILYPSRRDLADALQRLNRAGVKVEGVVDHGVSEALYLKDPDGNGVELYWDKPRDRWPRAADGALQMYTQSLDANELLRELQSGPITR
jgi:catechol 2,3-dioxygenase